MPRIMWTRYSVMHDNYESFVEYVTKNIKEAYPKACDLQFTQPEYEKHDNSAIECSPDFWGMAGYWTAK